MSLAEDPLLPVISGDVKPGYLKGQSTFKLQITDNGFVI